MSTFSVNKSIWNFAQSTTIGPLRAKYQKETSTKLGVLSNETLQIWVWHLKWHTTQLIIQHIFRLVNKKPSDPRISGKLFHVIRSQWHLTRAILLKGLWHYRLNRIITMFRGSGPLRLTIYKHTPSIGSTISVWVMLSVSLYAVRY